MKKDFAVILSLLMVLALVLTMVTYAQEPEQESREELEQEGEIIVQEIGAAGLDDPAPAGFFVLYMFSGVVNDTTDPDEIATVVHCTNYGSAELDIRVELFATPGNSAGAATSTASAGETITFSSQLTDIFLDNVNLSSGSIAQGSGRVMASGSTVICTAQLVKPDGTVPEFMVKLHLFDRNGNLVGSTSRIYLPIIIKSS